MQEIEYLDKAREKIIEAIIALKCTEHPYLCDDCENRLSCNAMHDALFYIRKFRDEYYKNKLLEMNGGDEVG